MTWAPGQSGNPAGRPRGIRSKVGEMREQLADDFPEILKVLSAAARKGDVRAARIIAERVMPVLRSESAPIRMTLPAGSLTEQAMAITREVVEQDLPPDVGAELIAALRGVAAVQEGDETQRYIADLERRVDELSRGMLPTPSAAQMQRQIQQAQDERDAEQFGDLA